MTATPSRPTVSQRGVIVTPDQQVLVVQRATDGGWELPGGRLGTGEDAHAGLMRELREEIGLEPEIVAPVHTFAWQNDAGRDRYATYYYCRGKRREVSLSPEHDDAEWCALSTLAARLSDPQHTAVTEAFERHRTRLRIDS